MSGTSRSRAAGPAISGYAYQFDKTTLAILAAGDDETVVVEGVEDVDVIGLRTGQAIQCKYYAAQTYSLARIRDAIQPMLEAFAGGRRWNYRLYAHFKDQEPTPVSFPLTLAELKDSLTKHKGDPKEVRYYEHHADAVLEDFLAHFQIVAGPELEGQRQEVRDGLADALGAGAADVTDLHYPNALTLVMNLAMRTDQADRRITRKAFVEELDKRPAMYTRWSRELLGRERYLKGIRLTIKRLGLTKSVARRTVLLGAAELSSATTATSAADFVAALRFIGFGPDLLKSARPWTVILDADETAVRDTKRALIDRGVALHDGYEHLQFSAEAFDRDPLVNTTTGGKVIAVSYDVRVLSRATFDSHSPQLRAPDVLLAFDDQPPQPDLGGAQPRRLDVAGASLEEIGHLLGAFT
jgi:hypothetical protein